MLTVKFVDNETFDSLPYKNAGTSLGVADRNKGIAYVRDTGNPMDIFTAYHELEHLKGEDWEEHASPSEDGVYYKGFGDVISSVSSFIPGIGGLLGKGAGMLFGGGKQQQQQQPQQPTMQQFNPATSMTSQQSQAPAAPATSSVGGNGGNFAGGEMGGSNTMDKVRNLLQQRQSGFYQGRDAGRM